MGFPRHYFRVNRHVPYRFIADLPEALQHGSHAPSRRICRRRREKEDRPADLGAIQSGEDHRRGRGVHLLGPSHRLQHFRLGHDYPRHLDDRPGLELDSPLDHRQLGHLLVYLRPDPFRSSSPWSQPSGSPSAACTKSGFSSAISKPRSATPATTAPSAPAIHFRRRQPEKFPHPKKDGNVQG